jgi:hypothetical protein
MYGQQPSSLEVYIPMDGTTYLRDWSLQPLTACK